MLAMILASLLFAADTASPSPASSTPAPSSAAIPDGTYTYEFRAGGSTIGTSVITITRASGAMKAHEVASLQVTYTVDSTLDPATFSTNALHAVVASTPVDVAFGSTSLTETAKGKSFTLPIAAGAKGYVVLTGPVMTGFFLTAAQVHATGSMVLTGVDFAAAQSLLITLVQAPASSRPATVGSNDIGYVTKGLTSGDVTIWADPSTLVPQEMDVPSQGISIVLTKRSTASMATQATSGAVPTPLPTAFPHFTSSDISFTSRDGTKLAGTITVPDHATAGLPAVVLDHGSRSDDRNEQVGPNPIFLELSNALSNHGFVVLRYDKRGIGKSGGDARTATRDDLLNDARAAIAFVQRSLDVDPRRVFVLGHSEGGELAPSLAAEGAPVRGIALMAPPAIPLDQIIMQQATRGMTGAARTKADAAEQEALDEIRKGQLDPGGAGPWLRSSFGIDPAQVIKRVPCPILILQSGKDFQVLAKDLPRLVNAAKAAHRDVTVRVFPNDDHLFITVPSGQTAVSAEYLAPHRVDPAMIGALLAWLRAKM